MERLAALEAEVKADADAQRARKEAAQAKVREQRAVQQAERDELRERQSQIVAKKSRPVASSSERADHDADHGGDLGGALELAKRAHGVRQELTRTPKQGDKSWVKSGVASVLLGPIGWLYAGSMREAVPASAAWLAFAALASKMIPMFLLFPVLLVALPLSGIAGLLYAVQYNRTGTRQRLFGDKAKKKQLRGG
ncbi:MAG: uncharacterized protein JWP01_2469 [Myxococcales bacterium]|nr:uncharacterized protein [Myxococcales bacterium]